MHADGDRAAMHVVDPVPVPSNHGSREEVPVHPRGDQAEGQPSPKRSKRNDRPCKRTDRPCGPICKGCKSHRCVNAYRDIKGRGWACELSPYCEDCERPPCAFCGNEYGGKQAFAVGSGKEYFCDNKACQKKLRTERGS